MKSGPGSTVKSISPNDLKQRLASDAPPFLLDIREPEELADGIIEGAVNIPMDDVEARLGEIPKDADIVVFCHLGGRSAFITKLLNALGYERAVNLSGGMEAWLRQS